MDTLRGLRWLGPGLRRSGSRINSEGLSPGNILLVTVLIDGDRSKYTANFAAKVTNSQEVADALLVMTFDPSKGAF
jgi:hypothetical protein